MGESTEKLTMADTYQSFMYHHGYKLRRRSIPFYYCPRCQNEEKCKAQKIVNFCSFKRKES